MTVDLPGTITALAALVTAVGVVLIGYWSYRAKERASRAVRIGAENKAELVTIRGQVFEVGERLDGRLSALLEATAGQARAEGVAEGTATERGRG